MRPAAWPIHQAPEVAEQLLGLRDAASGPCQGGIGALE